MSKRVRWRRSIGDFVDSKDGRWKITPLYCGRTRPEVYQLLLDDRVVSGNCATQREAKAEAERIKLLLEFESLTSERPAKRRTAGEI